MSPVVVTQPPETLHLCQQPPRVPRQEQEHLCRWPHSRTGEPSVLRQKEKHQHGAWQQVLAPAEDSCASYPKSCHLSGNCIPISLRNPGLLRQPRPLWYCPRSPRPVYSIISATLVFFSLVPQFQRETQPSLSPSEPDLKLQEGQQLLSERRGREAPLAPCQRLL